MRVYVVGLGSMGRRHASNAAAMGHSVTTYDPTDILAPAPASLAAGLARAQPDAVVIAAPAAIHGDVAQELSFYGYDGPLFVEKPLAVTPAAAAPFVAWPHQTTQVGYNWRFHPLVECLRAQLPDDAAVTEALLWVTCDRTTWPGKGYADTLLECSHEIDTALCLLGPAVCTGAASQGTTWVIGLRHVRGCRSRVVLDDHALNALPTRGIHLRTAAHVAGYALPPPGRETAAALEESYRLELAHFLRCAAEDVETDCTFRDGLAVLRIIEDARRLKDADVMVGT